MYVESGLPLFWALRRLVKAQISQGAFKKVHQNNDETIKRVMNT